MSAEQDVSRPTTPMTTETVIHRPTTPQAPKKPMAKLLKYLKPTVYTPEYNNISSSHKVILDALSRAGVRKSSEKSQSEGIEKTYPAPRKLTVHIVDGKTDAMIHKYVPTHLLMGISSKAAEVLESKPWAGRYKIYGKYNPTALSTVCNAVVHSQPIPVSTTNLVKNLLTYEACLRLGIASAHSELKGLLTAIYTQISATPIDNEVLAFVTYHLGSKDPVFKHMANVLCHQRFTKSVPDVQAFEKMVAQKPTLQKAMVQIDQAHKARREAVNATKRGWSRPEGGETDVKSEPAMEEEDSVQSLEEMLEEAALDVEKQLKKEGGNEEQKEKLLKLFKQDKTVGRTEVSGYVENVEKTEELE